jgi:hypothetical protein
MWLLEKTGTQHLAVSIQSLRDLAAVGEIFAG